MARIPARLLEHTVILRPIRAVPSSSGGAYLPAITTRGIVMDKVSEVLDQREGTAGGVIQSSAHVLVQPEFWIPPRSLLTIWPDTPMERNLEIAACALGKHSIAWESAQFWGV